MSTVGIAASAVAKIPTRSPPGPFKCGSTTCSTKAPATAASNAFPPRSRTACALAVASQWVNAAIPNDPVKVGRVVNGGGAVYVMRRSAASLHPRLDLVGRAGDGAREVDGPVRSHEDVVLDPHADPAVLLGHREVVDLEI